MTVLVGNLPAELQVPEGLLDSAKALDKHYVPTRYPNGFEFGAPTDSNTLREAEEAIQQAKRIIEFCRYQIG